MALQFGPDTGPDAGVSPLIEHARLACRMHRVSFEGTDPQSVRVPADAVGELLQGLAKSKLTSVRQIVPFTAGHRPREAFAGLFWRQLAQRCRVQRYYLVPSGRDILRQAREQASEDGEYALISRPVPVEAWGSGPQVPMNDLWLIDEQVVVRREVGRAGAASWVVSGHTSEVEQAVRLLDEAHRGFTERSGVGYPCGPDLTDVMLESAQMLYTLARMSCTGSQYIDAKDCLWYHGSWQYLRLFDMVSSPSWHTGFYADELRKQFAAGARRVLISGTADYTTLAFVLDAARAVFGAELPKSLEIHVLDLCQTPLLACQWYAGRLGLRDRVRLHRADITEGNVATDPGNAGNGRFDLIVADAFLTRFDAATARRVVHAWGELLVPGGIVLTTVRLHPRNDYRVHDTDDLTADDRYRVTDPADDFELRLLERAAGWQGMLSIDLDDLSKAGRDYAMKMKSHDLGDTHDIAEIFNSDHFDVTRCDAGRVDGELIGTEYLRIAATLRPAVGGSAHRPQTSTGFAAAAPA
jgi:SAM-dependent methyltransferase